MTMLPASARIDRANPLPRHYQVRQILLDMIQSGLWQPGEKIPAETEIAQALGISKMTVNKAILALTSEGVFYREVGRGTFVTQTPQESMGARGLPEGAQVIEVVIVGAPEYVSDNEYLCSLLLSMRCCVSPLEVQLRLRQARGAEYVTVWQESHASGWVLIAPLQQDVPGLKALAAAGSRAVVLGASWEEVGLPCVDSDNVGGAAMAVEHLIALGHRHIGMLYGEADSINTRDRIRGFQDTLRRHDLPFRADWMIDVGSDASILEAVRQRLRTWQTQAEAPSALFAAGPYIARQVLDIAQELGIAVPTALSIVGFDDPTAVAEASPVLTTVRQPLEAMAKEAITALRAQLAAPDVLSTPMRRILPCRLLVRDSTAPPMREAR